MFKRIVILMCLSGIVNAGPYQELRDLIHFTSLRARFTQTLEQDEPLSGELLIKKPNQFRWEVFGEGARMIVSDGKTLWDFDKTLEQITVQTLEQNQLQAPIFLMSGSGEHLEEDFQVVRLPGCFELTPKAEDATFQWVQLCFQEDTLQSIKVLDALGQTTQFEFTEVRMNEPLSEELFAFVPPDNIDVVVSE